jgi:hypothetical protein
MQEYLTLRKTVAAIEKKVKEVVKVHKTRMAVIEGELAEAATEAGLSSLPTAAGTGYWTTHVSCKSANSEQFFQYVQDNDRWDLLDKRPLKKSVGEFVALNGVPPPGLDYNAVSVFRIRENSND